MQGPIRHASRVTYPRWEGAEERKSASQETHPAVLSTQPFEHKGGSHAVSAAVVVFVAGHSSVSPFSRFGLCPTSRSRRTRGDRRDSRSHRERNQNRTSGQA